MSNKAVVWGIIIVVVIGGLIFLGSQGGGGDNGTGPVKIGFLAPLTGDAVQYGESESRAVQIAVDEINGAGGINGRMIELVQEDGKCDPQAGGSAAQKLVNIDKVRIIIGGACSGETLAAAKITEPAKVVLISPSASSPDVTTAGDFVFRTYPSDSLAGRIAAKYAFDELGLRKIAIIAELTDYAQGLQKVFDESFKAKGGAIVTAQTYVTGEFDFRTLALKVKAENPDAVYLLPQTATPGVALLKQLRENNVKVPYLTAEVLLDREIVSENAAVLEGVYGIEPAVDYEGNAKANAFRAAHQEKFGADPGAFAANAYDAVYLLKEAIEANGGIVDTEKIRDFLYEIYGWQGAVGSLTIDGNGDPLMGLSVRQIKAGEVTDMGPYTP